MSHDACAENPVGCQINDLFRLLGKTHMLDILHTVIHHDGPARFVDIQRHLSLSPNTLSARLKEFVEAGLLERTAYNEIPPRVDYTPTTKAYALRPVFEALGDWARTHNLSAEHTGSVEPDVAASA